MRLTSLVLAISSLVCTFANCQNKSFHNKGETVNKEDTFKLGNNPGNIINNQLIASDSNRIYYVSTDSTLGMFSMKLDGSDVKRLSYDNTEYINVLNGWIYYRKVNSDKKPVIAGLYKMRTDGSQEQLLVRGTPFYINVVNDWIYFVNSSAGSIWKIKTDGNNLQKLYSVSKGNYECLTTDGRFLYFGWYRDSVFKATLDGTKLTKILSGNIEHPTIYDDLLYYKTDNYKLYRINTTSLKVDTLFANKNLIADYFLLKNGELYFAGDFGIQRFSILENKLDTLLNKRVIAFGIAADYVYYTIAIWDENNERHTKTYLRKLGDLKILPGKKQ